MKMRLELEIDVRAYTPEELASEAEDCMMSIDELGADGSDDDLDAAEIGQCIASAFYEGMDQEMFAGSGIYVKLGDASVIRAEMVSP